MQLQLLNNASLLNVMGAAAQAACSRLVNLAAGSVLRAILQANASVALWVQWLCLQVLQTTRAATSTGSDLDSWVADYGLARLPAVAATGNAVLSRQVTTSTVLVAAGGALRTGDGLQNFVIVEDPGNAAWSVSADAYQLLPGQGSITVPVVASIAGSAGNVQPGAIALLASAMPGVDGVSNPVATTGGLDAESDTALRSRAALYFASLSRATTTAVEAAVASVQQGLSVLVQENIAGAGNFIVVVDDGSGHPAAALLQSVYTAVDAVRPIGSVFTVQGPVLTPVAVSAVLTTASGANHAALVAQVQAAIAQMVNALPIGATLPVTRVAAVAYNVSPSVLNISVLLNGASADLVPGASAVIRALSVAVL